MSNKVVIACVGGFLGAGKTTALQSAVREIMSRGLRVGVITNDQGTELVDTLSMREKGVAAEEISGGCFCCKFDDLVASVGTILDREQPHIILAEAVGSCTDLSATVYQPLRRYYGHQFDLAPLTIIVEPARFKTFSSSDNGQFDKSVRYLFEKQLAEADLILLNKMETITARERGQMTGWILEVAGNVPVQSISALTGQGVPEWVDRLLARGAAGTRVLDVDYDRYAAAEASLGWLNATVEVSSSREFSPKAFAESFIAEVKRASRRADAAIAHVKAFVSAESKSDRIALVDTQSDAQWSGAANFVPVRRLSLVVNARIGMGPEELSQMIDGALELSALLEGLSTEIKHRECFSPKRPTPVHRLAAE